MAAAREAKRITIVGKLTMGHKGPAVEIAFDPQAEWGIEQVALGPGRRGYPIEVLLGGLRFRSAIVSRMRRFFVLVEAGFARRAGVEAGSSVKLTVWPDFAHEAGSAGGGAAGHDLERTPRRAPSTPPTRAGNELAKKARRPTGR